jgi:hypothetical protein
MKGMVRERFHFSSLSTHRSFIAFGDRFVGFGPGSLPYLHYSRIQGQHTSSSGAPGTPEDERDDQGTLTDLRSPRLMIP